MDTNRLDLRLRIGQAMNPYLKVHGWNYITVLFVWWID
jgi:hypothetical protein